MSDPQPQAILLSGGYSHPFEESSPALAFLMEQAGFVPTIVEDMDTAISRLADGPDLLAVNALRWSMTQHEKYAPDRARYAYDLPREHMDAIADYVAQGGCLFALHVATICFDTQPRWREILGGGWQWGHSHHPPMGAIQIELTDKGAGISNGPDRFELIDEVYHNLDPATDCEVLATCTMDYAEQPLAWLRRYHAGRVAVDALGHDARSIMAPGHHELISAQLAWLRGDQDA